MQQLRDGDNGNGVNVTRLFDRNTWEGVIILTLIKMENNWLYNDNILCIWWYKCSFVSHPFKVKLG